MKLLTCLGVLALVVTACTHHEVEAQSGRYALTDNDKLFLEELRSAVRRNDRVWLADRISYPLLVTLDGRRVEIRNKNEFLARYSEVVTCDVQLALERQDPDRLFKNWRGLMIGRGEMWYVAIAPDTNRPSEVDYFVVGINSGP